MSTDSIIQQHVLWACAAGALPVPLVDLAVVTAIQLDMLKQLANHFDIPYSEEQGKAWVTALSGSIAARLGGNILKMIPGVGSLLGGISMSIMSGASTYAVGQVAVQHFSMRGTFDDLDTEKAKSDFKEAYEEGKQYAKDVKAEKNKDQKAKKDILEILEQLSQLHEKGILSDEEFATKKADILSRL